MHEHSFQVKLGINNFLAIEPQVKSWMQCSLADCIQLMKMGRLAFAAI